MNSGALIRASAAGISDNRIGLFGLEHKLGLSVITANRHLQFRLLYYMEFSIEWFHEKDCDMVTTIVSGGFKVVFWSFAAAGFASVLLAGLIAWPVHQPPELKSISAYRNAMDFSALPELTRFQARDGSALAYRHYPRRRLQPAGSPSLCMAQPVPARVRCMRSRSHWPHVAYKPMRWTSVDTAPPETGATSPIWASLKTTWPIS